jgi:hypothetical protein
LLRLDRRRGILRGIHRRVQCGLRCRPGPPSGRAEIRPPVLSPRGTARRRVVAGLPGPV